MPDQERSLQKPDYIYRHSYECDGRDPSIRCAVPGCTKDLQEDSPGVYDAGALLCAIPVYTKGRGFLGQTSARHGIGRDELKRFVCVHLCRPHYSDLHKCFLCGRWDVEITWVVGGSGVPGPACRYCRTAGYPYMGGPYKEVAEPEWAPTRWNPRG